MIETCREFTVRKVLTVVPFAGSVPVMETCCGLVELNKGDLPVAVTSRAYSYWFTFTYYAPPALLVEREAHMR